MRDIFTDIFQNGPPDPMQAARRAMRPPLRKRFYQRAEAVEAGKRGFALQLDRKPVKTPARRLLVAPKLALAERMADEWNAQREVIDPARMPLTRLANAIIDTVGDSTAPVAAEVASYLGSDLVCYRAEAPEALIARQAQYWDPVIAWAHTALGARFVAVAGVMFASQPAGAIAAARAAIPDDPWRLGAVSSITTLTGSALLALALARGAIDAQSLWSAAHVDEDWQMEQWGRDELVLAGRAYREAEFAAAALVLRTI